MVSHLLSCRGQGIGKRRRTISSWLKRTVHGHGTTLRQSVQRYRCRLYLSLFFSHILKGCQVARRHRRERSVSFKSLVMSLSNCRRVLCKYMYALGGGGGGGVVATLRCPRSRACFTVNSSASLERFSEKMSGNMR